MTLSVKVLIALAVAGVLAYFIWDYVDTKADNRENTRAIKELTRGIQNLDARADRYDEALTANQTFDTDTDTQASKGVAANERARRTDRETIAIDQPWPAAMRHRVFVNPDPASGSTEAASAPAARER